ncbi:hypothetical protein ACNS7O_02295 [Haloferacaceae archaeon DSL9]
MAHRDHDGERSVTTDREEIRSWVETRNAVPVRDPAARGAALDIIGEDEVAGDREVIGWDEFFERFTAESLAFAYEETETGDWRAEFVDRRAVDDPGPTASAARGDDRSREDRQPQARDREAGRSEMGTAEVDVRPSDDDVGKRVAAGGDELGVVAEVRGETVYVEPDPGLVVRLKTAFGFDDPDEETHPVEPARIRRITDEEIEISADAMPNEGDR